MSGGLAAEKERGMNDITIDFTSTNVPFRGTYITLTNCDNGTCPHGSIAVMHHHDAEGNHYCPTGFVICEDCGGIGSEPEPYECTLWKQKPERSGG